MLSEGERCAPKPHPGARIGHHKMGMRKEILLKFGMVKAARLHAVERGEVGIEQDLVAAYEEDAAPDALDRGDRTPALAYSAPMMLHHNPGSCFTADTAGRIICPVKYPAVLGLCLLFSACSHTPVTEPPPRLFSDHLFAAPSERISAEDVFALSDEMKSYIENEMAGPLMNKGLHKGLLDALYAKNQR